MFCTISLSLFRLFLETPTDESYFMLRRVSPAGSRRWRDRSPRRAWFPCQMRPMELMDRLAVPGDMRQADRQSADTIVESKLSKDSAGCGLGVLVWKLCRRQLRELGAWWSGLADVVWSQQMWLRFHLRAIHRMVELSKGFPCFRKKQHSARDDRRRIRALVFWPWLLAQLIRELKLWTFFSRLIVEEQTIETNWASIVLAIYSKLRRLCYEHCSRDYQNTSRDKMAIKRLLTVSDFWAEPVNDLIIVMVSVIAQTYQTGGRNTKISDELNVSLGTPKWKQKPAFIVHLNSQKKNRIKLKSDFKTVKI